VCARVCVCGGDRDERWGDEGERGEGGEEERLFMSTFANNAHYPTPISMLNCIYCTLNHIQNSTSLIEETVLKAVKWFPDPFVVPRQCSWTGWDANINSSLAVWTQKGAFCVLRHFLPLLHPLTRSPPGNI